VGRRSHHIIFANGVKGSRSIKPVPPPASEMLLSRSPSNRFGFSSSKMVVQIVDIHNADPKRPLIICSRNYQINSTFKVPVFMIKLICVACLQKIAGLIGNLYDRSGHQFIMHRYSLFVGRSSCYHVPASAAAAVNNNSSGFSLRDQRTPLWHHDCHLTSHWVSMPAARDTGPSTIVPLRWPAAAAVVYLSFL